ncbi:hypothetical protein D9M69_685090 [compost metagenome]
MDSATPVSADSSFNVMERARRSARKRMPRLVRSARMLVAGEGGRMMGISVLSPSGKGWRHAACLFFVDGYSVIFENSQIRELWNRHELAAV